MSDAQRNVIISLKLAANPQNQAIADQVARQAEYTATAGVIAGKKAEYVFQRVEAGKTNTHSSESNKRTDIDLKEKSTAGKAANSLAKQIESAENLRTASHQKANEAGLIAVQGMADMVEGAAKLGLVSEDNLQKFIKQYIVVQEGIRIFKGATDMWWKGREALTALSKATNAQTAANNLMTSSNARSTGTQAAGGAVAGATGGTLATEGTALEGAAVLGVLAAKAAVLAGVALAAAEGIQYFGRALGFDWESPTEAVLGWRDAMKQAEEATKKTARAEQMRDALERDRTRHITEETTRIDLQGQLRGAGNLTAESRAVVGGETDIQQANRSRLNAIEEVRAAETELAEHRIMEEFRVSQSRYQSNELTLRLLKDREEAQKRLYDAEVNRLNVIRAQNQATTDALKSERERLVTLQEQQRTEEQSLNAKLGQLDPGMQKRTIEIAKKIKAGEELNRRDVSILEEAGVGQEQVQSFYEKKGKRVEGADVYSEVFGNRKTKEDIADAEEGVEIQRNKLIKGQKQETEAGQQVNSTAGLLQQSTEARVKLEAELRLMFTEQVKGLQENAKLIQQAGADAADAINQQGMATIDSIKVMQDATAKGYENMQKQFEKFQLTQNNYKQS